MKKLAQCAVLLAFALAFVGCNLEDEKPTTVQDALNGGGEVNLNEYDDFLNSGTYTVSKDTVITGEAKGASFIVTDGADVTFNNTGNIGKVTVKNSGSKIELQGEGVTVATVVALANCTISSESKNNSIENVAVGKDVNKLTLDGKMKVGKLALEEDTTTPTITVSKDVEIEKADETVKDTVTTPDGKPAGNQVGETLTDDEKTDLKGELEESKKDPADNNTNNNFIATKEDLTKCVKNIIKKYYDFANEVNTMNNSRAATTASTDDISNQLKEAFDAVYKPFYEDEELAKSFIKLFTGKGATKNINFEGKVDLTNVGVNNGLDAFIDFANYAQDYFPSDDDDDEMPAPSYNTTVRKASDSEQITRQSWFGSNYKTVNAFLNVADKYASIPRLYLLAKLNVNTKATGNTDYASATAKADIQIEAKNINGMIPELFKTYSKNVETIQYPSSANLPVTAIKPFVNVDANVALTKDQYDEFVKTCENMPGWEDEPEWNFQYPNFSYPEFSYQDCPYPAPPSYWDEEAYNKWYEQYGQTYYEWQEAYDSAQNKYWEERWDAERTYWQEYREAYYEYDKKWDAEWDAWYENHRKELKNYFLNTSYKSKACSCKINVGVSTTVTSTASVPGGIITLSVEGNYTDPGKIIALIMAGPEIGFSSEDDEDDMGYSYGYYNSMRAVSTENRREGQNESDYVTVLKELEKDYGIKPTVTVTDYNGRQTFALSGIDNIIGIITDIVDNIGEIIQ